MSVSSSTNYQEKEPRKETIRELASRHLRDPNHRTTDEEIRNAKVVVDSSRRIDGDFEKMLEVNNTVSSSI